MYSNSRRTDTISDYRTQLNSETERRLAQTENDLDRQLAKITSEFGGQLRIVANFEESIFKPISEERLEISSGSPEENAEPQKKYATLAERMRAFEKMFAEKAAHLETLWKEWHATNLELVCLAVEVLGPNGVQLNLSQEEDSDAAKILAALEASSEHECRRANMNEKGADLENSVSALARETVNNLNEQEKVGLSFGFLLWLVQLTCSSSFRSGQSTKRRKYRR